MKGEELVIRSVLIRTRFGFLCQRNNNTTPDVFSSSVSSLLIPGKVKGHSSANTAPRLL